MKRIALGRLLTCVFVVLFLCAGPAPAQNNLEINTPAIRALKQSLRERHQELRPLYEAGAVGLARNGNVALRDASSVPLAQRGRINALIAEDNADRASLYREIARANGRPEWEADVRATFAQRWIERAPAGWWVEESRGWARK